MINDDYNGNYIKREDFLHRTDKLRNENAVLTKELNKALCRLQNSDKKTEREIKSLEYDNKRLKMYEEIVISMFKTVAKTENRHIKEKALIEIFSLTQPVIKARVTVAINSIPIIEQKGNVF